MQAPKPICAPGCSCTMSTALIPRPSATTGRQVHLQSGSAPRMLQCCLFLGRCRAGDRTDAHHCGVSSCAAQKKGKLCCTYLRHATSQIQQTGAGYCCTAQREAERAARPVRGRAACPSTSAASACAAYMRRGILPPPRSGGAQGLVGDTAHGRRLVHHRRRLQRAGHHPSRYHVQQRPPGVPRVLMMLCRSCVSLVSDVM